MADNYPEAARKHVLDSEALLGASRYDGAGYLAGYAFECTLKTLIWVETRKKGSGGHDLNSLSAQALQLASLPTQKTAKYVKGQTATSLRGPDGWRSTLRYEPEGTISRADCEAWVSEARRLHDQIIVPMKSAGVL